MDIESLTLFAIGLGLVIWAVVRSVLNLGNKSTTAGEVKREDLEEIEREGREKFRERLAGDPDDLSRDANELLDRIRPEYPGADDGDSRLEPVKWKPVKPDD